MAKYKVGDKVRIVSERPATSRFVDSMVQYLGKTLTVSKVEEETLGAIYRFQEATYPARVSPIMEIFLPKANGMWAFCEDWIAGLAEPEREPCTVELRFDGMITTATLKRGGRDVKTAEARCNPADTYSRGEGAKIAVERLFEKKKPVANIEEKFVITKESPFHCFKRGQIVRLVHRDGCISRYKDEKGTPQYVPDAHVRPYKEGKA